MLSAQSTRDLNQAARAASRFLAELGLTLPHSKALDLVARLVGKPHHMAARADLPDVGLTQAQELNTWAQLQTALNLLTPEQLAMSITLTEGCDSNGDAEFYPSTTFCTAGDRSLQAASDGVLEPEQPVLVFASSFADPEDRALVAPIARVEGLCRILAHPDLDEALHEQALSDAAYAELALAAAYVSDEVLEQFSPDALQQAYDSLPVTSSPAEFMQGHGNWSLTETELASAKRLAALLAPEPSSVNEDTFRLRTQYELATRKSGKFILQLSRMVGTQEALLRLNAEHNLALGLGPWVLASDSEQGYWCNDFGWVSSRRGASGWDKPSLMSGRWPADVTFRRYENAVDYPLDADSQDSNDD